MTKKPSSNRTRLTSGRVESFQCPPGKSQDFLWDTEAPTLALRATPTGRKTYVFEARLHGDTVRITLGTVADWSLPEVRSKARRYKTMVDDGIDPREFEKGQEAAAAAKRAAAAQQVVTFGTAWDAYVAERRPLWSDRHIADHEKLAQLGGIPRKNRKGVLTVAGPLAQFRPMPLREVTGDFVQAWAKQEAPKRAARVRLALRLLKAFLRWCADEPAYQAVTDAVAASGKKTREAAGKATKSKVVMQKDQLAAWFDAVRRIQNPVVSAYLQVLLLTGRRSEQVADLKWEDVDFKWRTISMDDKTEGRVDLPLTPYMAHLMAGLPRHNEWVFSSVRSLDQGEHNARRRERYHARNGTQAPQRDSVNASASGRIVNLSGAHRQACKEAGIPGLSLHGLRGSLASLGEWIDVPAGVMAQLQGHAPQGVREQHYIRRPLDLLRMWHDKIEAWVLEQAGVQFDPASVSAPGLRVAAVTAA